MSMTEPAAELERDRQGPPAERLLGQRRGRRGSSARGPAEQAEQRHPWRPLEDTVTCLARSSHGERLQDQATRHGRRRRGVQDVGEERSRSRLVAEVFRSPRARRMLATLTFCRVSPSRGMSRVDGSEHHVVFEPRRRARSSSSSVLVVQLWSARGSPRSGVAVGPRADVRGLEGRTAGAQRSPSSPAATPRAGEGLAAASGCLVDVCGASQRPVP